MKKEIGNSFWGIVDTAVYPIIYMAVVPLLMDNLGPEGFGLWVLINSLMVVLQLFNLNIGITTIKELAGVENQLAKKRLNGLLTIVLFMLVLVVLAGLISGVISEHFRFSGLENAPVKSIIECFALAGFISGLRFLNQLYFGALKAKELIRESAFLNIFNKVGLLAITVYLAVSGFDITTLLYGNVIFSLVCLLLTFIVVGRFYKGYKPSFSKDFSLMKGIFRFSLWPWLQSLFVVLAFQTDRFWVTSYSGLDVVADYGFIATLFNHIHMIYTAMFIWVLPRVASMANSSVNPCPFYEKIRGVFSLFVILSLCGFYLLSPYLFPLWIGHEHYQNMKAFIQLFVVFELLFSHTIMPFFYMNATGKEKQLTYLTGFFCFLSYSFMAGSLMITQNVEWMIIGMIISMFISMPVLNYFVKKSSGSPNITFHYSIIDMVPSLSAVAIVLLPMPWSLLFLGPIIIRTAKVLPLFNQFKSDGKIFSPGK